MSLQKPIAFCIFNRPELTGQVFQAIAKSKPKKLLVIGDGPRANAPNDAELVQRSRAVIEQVDWDCEVVTNFSEINLGCKTRMATGLDWAFDQSEELIILEDDCLPDPSFFEFCECLLDRYRDDDRIMMISGDNFQPAARTENSYYFSRWTHIWGWASWRSAWQHFDVDISSWPRLKASRQLANVFGSRHEYDHWAAVLDRQHAGEIDTWDFPWAYSCWANQGLTILPEKNLISNIGFGESATHTIDPSSRLANLTTRSLGKLKHPSEVAVHSTADDYTWKNILAPPTPQPDLKKKWYHPFRRKKVG